MVKLTQLLKVSLLMALIGYSAMSRADDRTSTTITTTVQPYMSVSAVTPAPNFILTPNSAQGTPYFDSSWTVTSNASNQQYIVTVMVDNADTQGPYMSLQNPPPNPVDPSLTRVHYQINYAPCGNGSAPQWVITGNNTSNSGPATFISNVLNGPSGVFTVCAGGGSGDLRFILWNTAVNPYPLSGSYLGQVTLIATPYS